MFKSTGLVLNPRIYTGPTTPPAALEDQSRFKNNGTFTNITQTRLPSGLWVMNFNGVSSVVDCGSSSSHAISVYTLQIWLLNTADNNADCIFGRHIGGAYTERRFAITYYGGDLAHIVANGAASTRELGPAIPAVLNRWYSVAAVNDGTSLYLYVNGQLTSAPTAVSNFAVGASTLSIGAAIPVDRYFTGQLALPKLYNRALSATEIYKLYASEVRWFR